MRDLIVLFFFMIYECIINCSCWQVKQNVREVCALFEYRSPFKNIEKETTTTTTLS